MIDYYLRAPDEATMISSLRAADIVNEEGSTGPGIDLSIIGTISKDGMELPGFHANLRTAVALSGAQSSELPLIDRPDNPVRVWFDTE